MYRGTNQIIFVIGTAIVRCAIVRDTIVRDTIVRGTTSVGAGQRDAVDA
jgi:hypothetical protein